MAIISAAKEATLPLVWIRPIGKGRDRGKVIKPRGPNGLLGFYSKQNTCKLN